MSESKKEVAKMKTVYGELTSTGVWRQPYYTRILFSEWVDGNKVVYDKPILITSDSDHEDGEEKQTTRFYTDIDLREVKSEDYLDIDIDEAIEILNQFPARSVSLNGSLYRPTSNAEVIKIFLTYADKISLDINPGVGVTFLLRWDTNEVAHIALDESSARAILFAEYCYAFVLDEDA